MLFSHWNLKELCNNKGINTMTELKRRLNKAGIDISGTEVAKLYQQEKDPGLVKLKVIDAILKVLGCRFDELFVVFDQHKCALCKEPASEEVVVKCSDNSVKTRVCAQHKIALLGYKP